MALADPLRLDRAGAEAALIQVRGQRLAHDERGELLLGRIGRRVDDLERGRHGPES